MKNLKSIIAYHNFPQAKDNSSEETTADTDLIDYDDDFDLIDRGDR